MSETVVSQSENEPIEQVFERCKLRTNGGKAAGKEKYVICETNHGIKFRIFWDDTDEEILSRYHGEMTAADRMLTTIPAALSTDVPLILEKAKKHGLCLLEIRHTGIVVYVSANDTPDAVVAKLNTEYDRRVAAGEMEPLPVPEPPRGIPTTDAPIAWKDLHPALRRVVITSLRHEMEANELAAAKSQAQYLALTANVSSAAGAIAPGQMMEGMMEGMMATTIGGMSATDTAIRQAFLSAILALEEA